MRFNNMLSYLTYADFVAKVFFIYVLIFLYFVLNCADTMLFYLKFVELVEIYFFWC